MPQHSFWPSDAQHCHMRMIVVRNTFYSGHLYGCHGYLPLTRPRAQAFDKF